MFKPAELPAPLDSAQPSNFFYRPVSEYCFSINIGRIHRAEVAAVIRQAAVITQNEIRTGGHDDFRIRPPILIGARHIILQDGLAVYVHAALCNADVVARKPDHALDEALMWVKRILENHDVAALDGFNSVNKFVNEDALLIVE